MPIARLQGQATDVDLARKELRNVKTVDVWILKPRSTLKIRNQSQKWQHAERINLLAKHTGKSAEQIEDDSRHPKYFMPSEAVEYGIIAKVLYNERSTKDQGVVSDLKKVQLL
ncbi:hypothetical protein SLEP1_g8975 [Rubroshorea leprosula]|uniref:ATP-dependent Clp protease proteolytic subunit n=1 Tax=Rubroshorea leprosula TaxID=152421 RepID=A0AAV5I3J8_9ROSI|nr:hypothetical protein SLEP1_g8975 [Rubroshorea leprosula]